VNFCQIWYGLQFEQQLLVEDDIKALYITDLDGTLLNSEKQLTDNSAGVINRFIAQGGLFSLATVRMAYGCDEKLAAINLNVPGIIMNGACLYSFAGKKYLDTCTINLANIQPVEDVLDRNGCNAFFYGYNDNAMSISYKMEPQPEDVQYLSKRAKEYCREISQVKSYTAAAHGRYCLYPIDRKP
jgi:hydroxymethylpyrimidine pyrophosphatase-like HAD family hydrolase